MNKHAPSDSTLLKTTRGYLLISPQNAVYCAVHEDEHDVVSDWLKHPELQLPGELEKRIREHGFFDGPRPFRPKHRLIQFQVTNACNLKCAYCSAESGCARTNEITLEDVKKAIDEAIEVIPDIDVSFTGGEPLIVPWIFEAIDYALSRVKRVGLLSNLLLTKSHPELLQNLVCRMKNENFQVQMSFSGVDREVCNRLSGRDCYDDGIEIVQKLAENGVFPKIDLMMSAPDAQANIDAFAEFRHALPENIEFSVGLLYPCGREKGEHIFKNRDDVESFYDDVTFEGGVSIPAQMQKPVTEQRKACSCVENENLFIRSDGQIFSCFKLVECYGNIREGIQNVVKRRRKEGVMAVQIPLCHNCPFVNLCAAGCRADNIILTGDK